MEENPRQLQEGDSNLRRYSEADISNDVLWQQIKKNSEQNLKSGFRATGLHPRNVEEPLKRLPNENVIRKLHETLLEWLKDQRGQTTKTTNRNRGPKVSPGVALSSVDVPGPSSSTMGAAALVSSSDSSETSEEENTEE